MKFKVIAMGNVLMKDDGVGIEAAKKIQDELIQKNIQVIFGETDIEYSMCKIEDGDYLFVLDAGSYGKTPGEITVIPLNAFVSNKKSYSQHNYSFLDLLRVYYPSVKGEIYAIEVDEVKFDFGLSEILQKKLDYISKEILKKMNSSINLLRGD